MVEFKVNIQENQLFISLISLCFRSIYTVYQKMVTLKGIDLMRYAVPPKVFLNHTLNPDNQGFCTPRGVCLPSGLLNVSSCRQGKLYEVNKYKNTFLAHLNRSFNFSHFDFFSKTPGPNLTQCSTKHTNGKGILHC